jgi:hypothetical protein
MSSAGGFEWLGLVGSLPRSSAGVALGVSVLIGSLGGSSEECGIGAFPRSTLCGP